MSKPSHQASFLCASHLREGVKMQFQILNDQCKKLFKNLIVETLNRLLGIFFYNLLTFSET